MVFDRGRPQFPARLLACGVVALDLAFERAELIERKSLTGRRALNRQRSIALHRDVHRDVLFDFVRRDAARAAVGVILRPSAQPMWRGDARPVRRVEKSRRRDRGGAGAAPGNGDQRRSGRADESAAKMICKPVRHDYKPCKVNPDSLRIARKERQRLATARGMLNLKAVASAPSAGLRPI